jgi:hypothetical protein
MPKNSTIMAPIELTGGGNGTTNSTNSSSSSSTTNAAAPLQQVLADLLVKVKDMSFGGELLPSSVRFELDQLELELLEGDITQKGYDKKRAKLLMPYAAELVLKMNGGGGGGGGEGSGGSSSIEREMGQHEALSSVAGVKVKSEKIRIQRKKNREDANANRYHSGKFKRIKMGSE